MKWTYKDHDIELRGETFCASVGDKNIRLASLSAVKKAIDKELSAKAAAVDINLPVLLVSRWAGTVESNVIIGVDTTTFGIQTPKAERLGRSDMVPDSEANRKLLADLIVARATVKELEESVKKRSFSTYLGEPSGRYKITYADACEKLISRYKAASEVPNAD